MEQLKGWPEGTRINNTPEGKKEIVLPEPTNMKEFSRKEIIEARKRNRRKLPNLEYHPSQQSSTDIEKLQIKKEQIFNPRFRKTTHPRQEQIKKERREEKKFRENNK